MTIVFRQLMSILNKPIYSCTVHYDQFVKEVIMKMFQYYIFHFIYLCYLLAMASCVNVLKFHHKRADGGARLKNVSVKLGSPSLSFCLDYNIKLVKYSKLLSVPGSDDLQIEISETLDRIYTQFRGIWYMTPLYRAIEPHNFGTFCLSYNSSNNQITLANNGRIVLEMVDTALLESKELSQDLVSKIMLGERSKGYTFIGEISGLNIWSRPLLDKQIEIKSSCNGHLSRIDIDNSNLLEWESSEWDLPDWVELQNISTVQCKTKTARTDILLPYSATNLNDGVQICNTLGGRMSCPNTEGEMRKILKVAESYLDKPTKMKCSRYLWLPYKINKDGAWAHFDGFEESLLPESFKPPPWLEWANRQPNGMNHDNCTAAHIGDSPYVYDVDCRQADYCTMCEFSHRTYFNIRGLCDNLLSSIDSFYLLNMEEFDKDIEHGLVWTGFENTEILLDKTLNRWIIRKPGNNGRQLILKKKVGMIQRGNSKRSL